jgi:hypothetical protein
METVASYLKFLAANTALDQIIQWPPDAFGCAAAILERSGSYLEVIRTWPPSLPDIPGKGWTKKMRKLGSDWRSRAARGKPPPEPIRQAWSKILKGGTTDLRQSDSLSQSLLMVLAAADEACEGVGIPNDENSKPTDDFFTQSLEILKQHTDAEASTLCKFISPEKFTVLPKLHTPRTGITIRSLSHHIAFCPAGEVQPKWVWADHPGLRGRHGLNVLAVPWPMTIHPSAFSPANPRKGTMSNMPDSYGLFDYKIHSGDPFNWELLKKIVDDAVNKCGSVDMIVLPELALTDSDKNALAKFLKSLSPRPIFISGLCVSAQQNNGMCRNTSVTIVPLRGGEAYSLSQDKHHRWLLDGGQVKQYGLGCRLDPQVSWWENTEVTRRELGFVSLQPWLTLCTLICEDLARPDPIANIVRAVGPNLIIALLLDGPQLARRWPARYGTVLADDPGSSVLTLSALGMVELSRPRAGPSSNVVALWKDAHSGDPIELTLESGERALLLSLTRVFRNEYSADGRDDEGSTSYLTLSGVHPISIDN